MPTLSPPQNFNKGTINQSTKKQTCTFQFYASSDDIGDFRIENDWGWGYSSNPPTNQNFQFKVQNPPYTLWQFGQSFVADCDDNIYTRTWGRTEDAVGAETWTQGKNQDQGKTHAAAPTVPTPTLDNATSSSIRTGWSTVYFVPATKDTSVKLYVQYREVGGSWTQHPAPVSGDSTGYSNIAVWPLTIQGLDPDTSYEFRYHLDRTGTTNGTTSYYSDPTAFLSTLPDLPDVTTDAATNVNAGDYLTPNDGEATLNGNVDRNAKTDAEWRFVWREGSSDLSNPDGASTWTATTSEPEDVDYGLVGLTETSTYYFRLEVRYDSGTSQINGSALSFIVPDDPDTEEEDQMHIYNYDGIQGEDITVYFTLQDPASGQRLVTTAPGTLFAAGDIKISIDGASFITPTNSVQQVAASNPTYYLTLDGASNETDGENIVVQIVDQDGPLFRDAVVFVRTKQRLSQLLVDASNLTDQSAAVFTGSGTGHGIEAIGGSSGDDINGVLGEMVLATGTVQSVPSADEVQLAAGEASQADYHNGNIVMIVGGTGAGQARVITDYDTNQTCKLDAQWQQNPVGAKYVVISGARPWDIVPGAELSSIPTYDSSYGQLLQAVFQRFAYKITQTATIQTWFKESTGTLGSRTVNDDGTTQTIAKIT